MIFPCLFHPKGDNKMLVIKAIVITAKVYHCFIHILIWRPLIIRVSLLHVCNPSFNFDFRLPIRAKSLSVKTIFHNHSNLVESCRLVWYVNWTIYIIWKLNTWILRRHFLHLWSPTSRFLSIEASQPYSSYIIRWAEIHDNINNALSDERNSIHFLNYQEFPSTNILSSIYGKLLF